MGFFDVLGYKAIQKNNQITEAITVVETIRSIIERRQNEISKWSDIIGQNFGEHVVISDSIVAFAPFEEDKNEKGQAEMFISFCTAIVNDLFWAGLPVRGALAYGDFYIGKTESGIYLAGAPLVEAHEFADILDFSGCVVGVSAEKFLTSQLILDDSDRPLGFIKRPVPIRNKESQKLEKRTLFILNHRAFFDHQPSIAIQTVLDKFGAFSKPLNSDAFRKASNTLDFFVACQ